LYERGYSRQDIKNLFAFIDWIMTLPKDLAERFNQELVSYEKEKNMPYVTSIERFAMEKGKLENAQDMILDALEAKFGSTPQEIKENILLLDDQTKLKKLHQEAILSQDLKEFSDKFHLLISNSE